MKENLEVDGIGIDANDSHHGGFAISRDGDSRRAPRRRAKQMLVIILRLEDRVFEAPGARETRQFA